MNKLILLCAIFGIVFMGEAVCKLLECTEDHERNPLAKCWCGSVLCSDGNYCAIPSQVSEEPSCRPRSEYVERNLPGGTRRPRTTPRGICDDTVQRPISPDVYGCDS
ncbi:hypothetical protein HELRODRAFT_173375 [Helobdella robusta]|uniref:EB domain-containing protein n=1 Tax=Helobdella robusta TaxID=6412 RepID=T1F6Q9_HELRO|nr:hypothetical protein HELRODRAFT_173375 [Helobdella robusta]ESO03677.1 hypothetical protein HELRODRAFT_173375 [Helobdella robusta]